MTIYVIRNGTLIVKDGKTRDQISPPPVFPMPMISRIETYESPVTGKEISSWRQRDADMTAVGAVDPRDLSGIPFRERQEENARQQQRPDDDAFQWGRLPD